MMARCHIFIVALVTILGSSLDAADKTREVIQDPGFRYGVYLHDPKPGKHVRYGELRPYRGDHFPKEFKQQDFGGTAKFIFTAGGQTFTSQSAHDRKWITIDKDLLPLMREALETAWERGFLKDSKSLSDYYIGGMNMGWELPGSFDVAMQVRGLSLKVKEHNASFRPD